MNNKNFEIVDIIENHIINNYLSQIDILFAKKIQDIALIICIKFDSNLF